MSKTTTITTTTSVAILAEHAMVVQDFLCQLHSVCGLRHVSTSNGVVVCCFRLELLRWRRRHLSLFLRVSLWRTMPLPTLPRPSSRACLTVCCCSFWWSCPDLCFLRGRGLAAPCPCVGTHFRAFSYEWGSCCDCWNCTRSGCCFLLEVEDAPDCDYGMVVGDTLVDLFDCLPWWTGALACFSWCLWSLDCSEVCEGLALLGHEIRQTLQHGWSCTRPTLLVLRLIWNMHFLSA